MTQFAIGISYASEDRTLVEAVAGELAQQFTRDRVFYDQWHSSKIQGRNALSKLSKVYESQCDLIVPFFSEHYKVKHWTNHEWRSIREVMFQRLDDDCVLPVFVSEVEMEGWPKSGLGIKAESKTPEQIAKELAEYLNSESNADRRKSSTETSSLKVKDIDLETPPANSGREVGLTQPQATDHNAPKFGSLVAIDLVNSSNLTGQQLREAISGLRLVAHDALGKVGANSPIVANYLDGLLIAPGLLTQSKVLELAEECLETMSKSYNVRIKGAIHRGDYYHVSNPDVIAGKKPHECIFLATLAASDQIVVSEAFVQHWIEDNGENDLPTVMPSCNEEPWEVEFKQGLTSRFRLVTHANGQAEVSRLLQEFSLANQALRRALEDLCFEFDDIIAKKTGIKARDLKTRISLFVPNAERTALVATTHSLPTILGGK